MTAIINDKRRSGNSTRIIDELVQTLFTEGECKVYDHHFSEVGGVTRRIREDNLRKLLNRLKSEHYLSEGDGISVDRSYLMVKLDKK